MSISKTQKITSRDVLKHSGGFVPPSFRTGKHLTEKDRPRKKYKPRDVRKEDW